MTDEILLFFLLQDFTPFWEAAEGSDRVKREVEQQGVFSSLYGEQNINS